jgi:membrane dipeptidase
MRVIDGHCDALLKLFLHPEMDFCNEERLDVNLQGLKKAGAVLQLFAIYLPESIGTLHFGHVLQYIDLFQQKVLKYPEIKFVRTRDDLAETVKKRGKIGAMLSLEGADGLEGSFANLRMAFQLGVRTLGLTWNYANWAGDGVLEPRQGGLTLKGKQLVRECNELGMILDAAHLAEKGFWDLAEISTKPFFVSHANARSVCAHARNLNDGQILALVKRDGIIGLTFVPQFLHAGGTASMADLVRHIEHVASLGGVRHIAFGSDFDGTDTWPDGLEKADNYVRLAEYLLRYYTEEEVHGFLWKNWYRFFMDNLPQ